MHQGFIADQQNMEHCMSGLLLIFEIPMEEISQQNHEEADTISMLSYSQASLPDRWSSTDSATDAPPVTPARCDSAIKSDHPPRIPRRPGHHDENTISSHTSATTTSKVDQTPRLPRRQTTEYKSGSTSNSLGDSTRSSSSNDRRPNMPRRTSDFVW